MMSLPAPTGTFRWTDTSAGPALVCEALTPYAAHFFTTRRWKLGLAGSADSTEGWREVAAAMDVDAGDLVRVHQVHGKSVVVVRRRGSDESRPGPEAGLPDADILITQDPGVALVIQSADCVPILIADRKSGAVAAAHAGWRGLAAGAPLAAVEALAGEFGTRPEDLIAAVGPSIGAARYEVDTAVLSRFQHNGFSTEHINRWFYDGERPDHWYFDGAQSAHDQLTVAGIPRGQVHVARLCTATHTDLLCSYRREGSASGRMAAAIRALR